MEMLTCMSLTDNPVVVEGNIKVATRDGKQYGVGLFILNGNEAQIYWKMQYNALAVLSNQAAIKAKRCPLKEHRKYLKKYKLPPYPREN